MSPRDTHSDTPSPGPATSDGPQGDPWHAFGYITAGVALYGFLGWLADQWLGTRFLVVLGILGGAVLGLYATWARFKPPPEKHDSA